MERNDIMMLNNILYHLSDSDNFTMTRKLLLKQLQRLIPYSYSSILLSNLDPMQPTFTDPVCVPEEFLAVEETYMSMTQKDHTLWTMDTGYSMVICESQLLPDHKRLNSPIYQECYSPYHIYDTLQINIVYNNTFLGVLTLYRTREDGAFTEENVFYMNLIGFHLNRLFYRFMVQKNSEDISTEKMELLREKHSLTGREAEILALLLEGLEESEIAERLHITASTLKKHMQHIYRKLGISTRWELVRFKG